MNRSDIIDLALSEDIGSGDLTARWFTKPGSTAFAKIVAREEGVLAGADVAEEVFHRVDQNLSIKRFLKNGEKFEKGTIVLEVRGPAAPILTAERTALNFIQRLSGVATLARQYVDAVRGTSAQILDTRKTTPGLRILEKAAVAAGGATNHRMGLHDMFMVKDNHIATGLDPVGLQEMILNARAANPGRRIEIEADTLEQAKSFFLLKGVDIILLDNMDINQMQEAVHSCPPHIRLEASGGVTLQTVRKIAETGVHFISVGALTHSAKCIDFALDFDPRTLPLSN